MIITILESRVDESRWDQIKQAYAETITRLDPGLVQTSLIQNTSDPAVWRILTIWQSRAALDAMRATRETPKGVLIFRAAGAEPSLTIWEVANSTIR